MQKVVSPMRIAVLQPAVWIICFAITGLFLSSCSSGPAENPDPEWTKESTRLVDNGYIVYVGSAEDMKPEKAMLKAEGQALEDLANECSLVPKGTRIEDRYSKKPKYATTAFVKIAVEFELCEEAKKANDPETMRKVAATSFMEQLKRYQDLEETGELSSASETSTEPPTQWPEAPVQTAGVSNQTQFFALRQTIFYQKEVVILSPPQYYAANSPETAQLNTSLQHNTQQLNAVVAANPELPKSPQTWSRLPQRPVLAKPASLHAPHRAGGGERGHELRPPPSPRHEQARKQEPKRQGREQGRGRGRRGRGRGEEEEERK